MRRLLTTLDEASANVERIFVLVLLSLMACVVFFDVVHRVASSPEGIVLRVLTLLAGGNPSEGTLAVLRSVGVPAVLALVTLAFSYGALRTRIERRSGYVSGVDTPESFFAALGEGRVSKEGIQRSAPSPLVTLAQALGLTAALFAAVFLILTVFPNGLVWSQPLALAMLLWVALFGATLATKARGHIAFEVADRIWPKAFLPVARLVAGLVAGGFSALIVVLSIHYLTDFYEQWKEGIGYISGVPLPKWVAYLAIPVTFFIMTLRFTAYAIGDFLTPPPESEPHGSGPGAAQGAAGVES